MYCLIRSVQTVGVGIFLLVASTCSAQAQALTGFRPSQETAQLACEAQLLDVPSPQAFRAHLERLTRDPHPTGSDANRQVAQYLTEIMEEAGLQVENYDYDLYLPSPEPDVDVALVTPIRQPLNNQEYVLEEDRFSDHPGLKEGWNAFSGSGDVTAEVVYANYGRKEDFEQLAGLDVSVEGKIVVARYGGNFRGFKAKFAEARGAVGLIIYSDPANGGYVDGAAYPEGRHLNESTIQRGSVIALDYWGDPLTPMEPALPTSAGRQIDRLDPSETDLHTIPVTPLPYGAAQEILKRMDGEPVPQDWQGGLPFTYRLEGGSDLTVRLRVDQPKALTRATNVVGTLEGSEFPGEWIILGAHYDAWTFGAVDPNSGTAMLLTLAEALGDLAEKGCRPRRTIKIAHWDAEEYGIIGSVEWVEQFSDELSKKAIAYINADAAVSGPAFSAASAPSLKGVITEATKAVAYPGTDASVHEHWRRASAADSAEIGNLGGGSDHVGFYTHVGVPSAGLSMSGASPIYHSAYDDFAWYERFADTSFVYGPTLARIDGIVSLRLANAEVLPYDVARYAADLQTHAAFIEQRAKEQGIDVDLSPLRAAIAELAEATAAFDVARNKYVSDPASPTEDLRQTNRALIGLEKAFIHSAGLQGRPWSRSLYASPDPFSGYASWMLPGLRYGVETGSADETSEWMPIYETAIENLTQRVQALTEDLNASSGE